MNLALSKLVDLHRPPQLVYDVGGYLGNYTQEILKRFDCKVVLFEPIAEYAQICLNKFIHDDRVIVIQAAAWIDNEGTFVYKKGLGSSQFKALVKTDDGETVPTISLAEYLTVNGVPDILKLNCEGAEYALLNSLREGGLLHVIKEVLVQFHKIDNYRRLYEEIKAEMFKTHDLVYSFKHWCLWQKFL